MGSALVGEDFHSKAAIDGIYSGAAVLVCLLVLLCYIKRPDPIARHCRACQPHRHHGRQALPARPPARYPLGVAAVLLEQLAGVRRVGRATVIDGGGSQGQFKGKRVAWRAV